MKQENQLREIIHNLELSQNKYMKEADIETDLKLCKFALSDLIFFFDDHEYMTKDQLEKIIKKYLPY